MALCKNCNHRAFPQHHSANFILSVQNSLNVDPWCDLLSSVSLTVDSVIDRLIHSAEVAHWTHTTEPMASHSHSGGPTAFRRNPSIAMTLSRPLRLTPNWASPGWPRVYQRHNDHRHGQNINCPTWGHGTKISTMGTQGYVCLPGQGTACPLPSLVGGTDQRHGNGPNKGLPIKANVVALGKTRFSGTMTRSQHVQVGFYQASNCK